MLLLHCIDSRCVFDDGTDLIKHHDRHEQAKHQSLDEVDDAQGHTGTRNVAHPHVLRARNESSHEKHTRINASEARVQQEQNEVFLVVNRHTIVHPRAVMVHTNDTPRTSTAMMCFRRFDGLAFFTCPWTTGLRLLVLERQTVRSNGHCRLGYGAWIRKLCATMRHQRERRENGVSDHMECESVPW